MLVEETKIISNECSRLFWEDAYGKDSGVLHLTDLRALALWTIWQSASNDRRNNCRFHKHTWIINKSYYLSLVYELFDKMSQHKEPWPSIRDEVETYLVKGEYVNIGTHSKYAHVVIYNGSNASISQVVCYPSKGKSKPPTRGKSLTFLQENHKEKETLQC